MVSLRQLYLCLSLTLFCACWVVLFGLCCDASPQVEAVAPADCDSSWCTRLVESSNARFVIGPLVMIICAILPIPAECPALVNGIVFGPWIGTLITWAGALIGAQLSFEISRRFGRPAALKVLPSKVLDRVNETMARGGPTALLLARLVPFVSFTVLNWALGLTSIRRSTFFWTTAVGILPGAVAFTASGSGLSALGSFSAVQYVLIVVLVLTLFWFGRRILAEDIFVDDLEGQSRFA